MVPLSTAQRRMGLWLIGLALLGGLVAGVGATALPLLAQTDPVTGIVNTEDEHLNLRSAPSTDASIVAKLDPETEVTILATSDDGEWLQVEVDGVGTGWVAQEYITVDEGAADISPTAEGPTEEAPADDSRGGERPRMGILGLVSPMTATAAMTSTVTPTLTVTPEPPATVTATVILTETPTVTATEPVTVVAVPAATTPDVTAPVVTATVTLTETPVVTPTVVATATAVATATEPALLLLPTPTPAAPVEATPTPVSTPTPEVPTAVTQPARMNVRGGPSTNFAVVGGVDAGTALVITGVSPEGDWYRVELDGVDEAWVYAPLVAVVGPVDAIEPVPEDELPVEPTPAPQTAAAVGGGGERGDTARGRRFLWLWRAGAHAGGRGGRRAQCRQRYGLQLGQAAGAMEAVPAFARPDRALAS